jgi:Nuclease A inhibitor-like protein
MCEDPALEEAIAADPDPIDRLKSLVEGLSWMSESDYPFEVASLPELSESPTAETLLQLTGKDGTCPVTEMSVQELFVPAIRAGAQAHATALQDGYGDKELETMQRFQTLVQWIEAHLSEVRVYRIGEIEIEVYIIGKTELGDWINLSTRIIET